MFGGIGSSIGNFAKKAFSGAGSGASGGIPGVGILQDLFSMTSASAGAGANIKSIMQLIEGPGDTGSRLGQMQKEYMDAAYPGTNPWERLGAGQSGSTAGLRS